MQPAVEESIFSKDDKSQNIISNEIPNDPNKKVSKKLGKYGPELVNFNNALSKIEYLSYNANERKSQKSESTKIRGYLTYIYKKGIQDNTEAIRTYLSKAITGNGKENRLEKASEIVRAIIQCREKGKRLILNNDLFKRKLQVHVLGSKLKTKCISNDYLYLLMTCSQILNTLNSSSELLSKCTLKSVKLTSANFRSNMDTIKGYIQDYDPRFSITCVKDTASETIASIIQNNLNYGTFTYNDNDFKYYGNSNICIVALNEVNQEGIVKTFEDTKYFIGDNKFNEGEKKVPLNDSVHFFDMNILPEDFCPSYWISPSKEIEINFYYTLEYDYTSLFETLDKKDNIKFPADLCYWDTITQFFDFIGVLALTSKNLIQQNKEFLASLVDEYFALKPYIRKWKENQLLLQRICHDFCSFFLSNSELIRFQRLYEKSSKYRKTYKSLINNTTLYQAMLALFKKIPCAEMINKQLNDNIYELGKRIRDLLGPFVKGKRSLNFGVDVRKLLSDIQALLPTATDNYTFPFIIAEGSLNGSEIEVDVVQGLISNIEQKQNNEKEKLAALEQSFNISFNDMLSQTRDYIKAYIKEKTKDLKIPDYMDLTELRDRIILAAMDKVNNKDFYTELPKYVNEYAKDIKNFTINKRTRNKYLENIIKTFLNQNIKNLGREYEIKDDEKKYIVILPTYKKDGGLGDEDEDDEDDEENDEEKGEESDSNEDKPEDLTKYPNIVRNKKGGFVKATSQILGKKTKGTKSKVSKGKRKKRGVGYIRAKNEIK